MAPRYEHLREVFEVTEYRDGAVYKTRSLGYRWVLDTELENPVPGFIYAAPSTQVTQKMLDEGLSTIRRIKPPMRQVQE